MSHPETDYRIDDIDRCILYALMQDGRKTTATAIAETVNVSGATVRNRIQNLEEQGIIRGYTAHIDFERTDGKLTNLYLCNVPVPEREALAQKARTIPEVINVRTLMTGRKNLHIVAVGEHTNDLQRVSRTLSQLGIEIEDEDLVEDEFFSPYSSFSPDDDQRTHEPNDFISLTGQANIMKLTVRSEAPITGRTLKEASDNDILDENTLIISIERDDRELTPHGDTVVQSDDIVTVLTQQHTDGTVFKVFQGSDIETVVQ
ncbi:Lrp/AsnC family transcriptional regulator [Halocatena pleomorpha]|uniref:Winged helix-turn-helix transcriptional regulator n=1 Tax=Halocatena pleomorpha TaxID=1785090 RepID=A0A3P3RGB2_9EURY|nr:winged helix-turn-helix transcriptional regulator [Halocatena pleomorpha]RRJ31473.1 winged helix-turn-helix transcriptional regulator [Halocatena pleomorpha]